MIYFDNAATTFPKPKSVIEKTFKAMTEYGANPGRSGHKLSLKMDREIFKTRELLTNFVGGDDVMKTIFTKNCTEGLNMAIKGLARKNTHVITTALEHNSVLRPLKELANQKYIDLTIVKAQENGVVKLEDIENAIREDTDMAVITAMSNLIGSITDIEKVSKLLKKHNITFILDAAQGIGYLDIDVKKFGVDVVCYPGHKSLFGPMGTGGIYINTDRELKTIEEGGTGSFSLDINQPKVYPDRLESGTLNGVSIAGLGAGIEFINKVGLKNIRDHENDLKDIFIKGLRNINHLTIYGPQNEWHGPVVTINIDNLDSSELAYKLDEHDIAVRAGFHCAPYAHRTIHTEKLGAARFSFSYFNTKEEINTGLEVLEKIAKEAN